MPNNTIEEEEEEEDKAIVIGGGIAGLLAARILSGHFSKTSYLKKTDILKKRGQEMERHKQTIYMYFWSKVCKR